MSSTDRYMGTYNSMKDLLNDDSSFCPGDYVFIEKSGGTIEKWEYTDSKWVLDHSVGAVRINDEGVHIESDPVNHPSHYTDGKIEVIDYIEDKKLNFHLANAVKYISRAGKKDPNKEIEDLEKAVWYIKRRIKYISEGNND